MLSAGAELVRIGVPIHAVLDQAEALRADADRIAERFVSLVLDHVWAPFVAAGMPAERLSDITDLVEKLRPLAGETLMPALAQAMEENPKFQADLAAAKAEFKAARAHFEIWAPSPEDIPSAHFESGRQSGLHAENAMLNPWLTCRTLSRI